MKIDEARKAVREGLAFHTWRDLLNVAKTFAAEVERLTKLLEPCKPDTDAQTDNSYPKTTNDIISLLSDYIADFMPGDTVPDDTYFAAWERQARPVIDKLVTEVETLQGERDRINRAFHNSRYERAECNVCETPIVSDPDSDEWLYCQDCAKVMCGPLKDCECGICKPESE